MTILRRRFLRTMPPLLLAPRFRDDPPDEAPGEGDEALLASLRPIRRKHGVPGLIAAMIDGDRPPRIAAVGHRKHGSPEPFGVADLVHLGSCTKAMTATMIATLVEEGKLSWGLTLAEALPDLSIDPGFRPATLA